MTTLDENTTEELRSNLDLIGREDINDLEAVLSFCGHYDAEGFHRVPDNCPAEFTWDYEKGRRAGLDKLYEKAKKAQWNGQTDLPWDTEVDQERVVMMNAEANQETQRWLHTDFSETVLGKWEEKDFIRFGVENQNWLLSQFIWEGLASALAMTTCSWSTSIDQSRSVEAFHCAFLAFS